MVSDPLEVIQRTEPGRLCLAANLREQQMLSKRLEKYQREYSDTAWKMTYAKRPIEHRFERINDRQKRIYAERLKLLVAHEKVMKNITKSIAGEVVGSNLAAASRAELVRFDVDNTKELIRAQRQRMYSSRSSPSLSLQFRGRFVQGGQHLKMSVQYPRVQVTAEITRATKSAWGGCTDGRVRQIPEKRLGFTAARTTGCSRESAPTNHHVRPQSAPKLKAGR